MCGDGGAEFGVGFGPLAVYDLDRKWDKSVVLAGDVDTNALIALFCDEGIIRADNGSVTKIAQLTVGSIVAVPELPWRSVCRSPCKISHIIGLLFFDFPF